MTEDSQACLMGTFGMIAQPKIGMYFWVAIKGSEVLDLIV